MRKIFVWITKCGVSEAYFCNDAIRIRSILLVQDCSFWCSRNKSYKIFISQGINVYVFKSLLKHIKTLNLPFLLPKPFPFKFFTFVWILNKIFKWSYKHEFMRIVQYDISLDFINKCKQCDSFDDLPLFEQDL